MKDVLAYFFKSLTICMAAGFCFIATAQNFPSKPIKIVVPWQILLLESLHKKWVQKLAKVS